MMGLDAADRCSWANRMGGGLFCYAKIAHLPDWERSLEYMCLMDEVSIYSGPKAPRHQHRARVYPRRTVLASASKEQTVMDIIRLC